MNMSEAMVLSVFLFKCVMNTLSKLVLLMSVNFVVSVCVCVCVLKENRVLSLGLNKQLR